MLTMAQLQALIKTFPKISLADYDPSKGTALYAGEGGINPGYTPLMGGRICPMPLNEGMIWCLRGDMILAIGVKNGELKDSGTNKGVNPPFADHFDPKIKEGYVAPGDSKRSSYFDAGNRYGHPTLAMSEPGFDGTAIYSGWIAQRDDRIDIYVFSGRYHNTKLTAQQVETVQKYVALKFMDAFGPQKIIFYEGTNDGVGHDVLTDRFLQNKPMVAISKPGGRRGRTVRKDVPSKVYTPKELMSEFDLRSIDEGKGDSKETNNDRGNTSSFLASSRPSHSEPGGSLPGALTLSASTTTKHSAGEELKKDGSDKPTGGSKIKSELSTLNAAPATHSTVADTKADGNQAAYTPLFSKAATSPENLNSFETKLLMALTRIYVKCIESVQARIPLTLDPALGRQYQEVCKQLVIHQSSNNTMAMKLLQHFVSRKLLVDYIGQLFQNADLVRPVPGVAAEQPSTVQQLQQLQEELDPDKKLRLMV